MNVPSSNKLIRAALLVVYDALSVTYADSGGFILSEILEILAIVYF